MLWGFFLWKKCVSVEEKPLKNQDLNAFAVVSDPGKFLSAVIIEKRFGIYEIFGMKTASSIKCVFILSFYFSLPEINFSCTDFFHEVFLFGLE